MISSDIETSPLDKSSPMLDPYLILTNIFKNILWWINVALITELTTEELSILIGFEKCNCGCAKHKTPGHECNTEIRGKILKRKK